MLHLNADKQSVFRLYFCFIYLWLERKIKDVDDGLTYTKFDDLQFKRISYELDSKNEIISIKQIKSVFYKENILLKLLFP